MLDFIKAAVLGVVEGFTEYLPVSSTGHLLLMQHFFGFGDENFGNTFAILIQFGAILALLSIYFMRIVGLSVGLFIDATARRFVIGIMLAFLPAAVLGALLHNFIKTVLFNPWIVCVSLIVGGIALVWVESLELKPRHRDVITYPMPMYFVIGVFQCLAMIPGVSRSGATIVSAMLLGSDRRAAAEFSFWLAMPTMAGAFAFDLWKSRHDLSTNGLWLIAVGFIVSFVFGWIVVKTFLGYVSRHGFMVFAWWRLAVGALGLVALTLGLGAH
ncbi:MAG TPA: undecaprenyl-diphosphate phosphatase [Xanthobacteraceae bacterium]|nr:undecaprenyl-diphosphate phosphatase [Xanthobacteraceae bacterium]